MLYRQVFDPELGEIVTQFELTTPDDFRRYLARRPSLSRGLAGLSVGHPVKEPPLDCLARISAASKLEVR